MERVLKYAQVEGQAVSPEELSLINKQSLRPLAVDEIFVFRVVACDNQIDRDFEQFSEKCLDDLAELFVGRTVISDHNWSAERQAARIYAAEVEAGGDLLQLVLRAYMLRGEQSAEMIAAIEAGILREVSVGCATQRAICSICSVDKRVARCEHQAGRVYDGELCTVTLDGAKDAYELSFVAVPAQPGAGIIKRYGGEEAEGAADTPADREALLLAKARQEQEEKRYGGNYL